MKIKRLETILVKEFLFLRIYTDDGLIGLGEAGLMSKTKTVEAAIRELERYLVGKDPLQIEYHWQHMYRTPFFRGGPVLNSAISAVDIALWDIAGKHFDVPVYQLLGGKCREKVRVYVHIGGRTPEELAESAVIASKRGFTAVRFAPFIEGEFQRMRYSRLIEMAESQVKSVRKAVGYDIDICLDAHGRLSPYEAIAMARALEKYKPFFFEDPILPENIDVMADIAAHTHIPIATGERLYTIYEFAHLLSKRAVHMVRPDISIAGGISQCKKIASMAEAYYVGVVPHSPFSPVMVAASVQLDTSIHNFTLQEYIADEDELPIKARGPLLRKRPRFQEIVKEPVKLVKGYLIPSKKPGIGVELNDKALQRHLYEPLDLPTLYREDESLADW